MQNWSWQRPGEEAEGDAPPKADTGDNLTEDERAAAAGTGDAEDIKVAGSPGEHETTETLDESDWHRPGEGERAAEDEPEHAAEDDTHHAAEDDSDRVGEDEVSAVNESEPVHSDTSEPQVTEATQPDGEAEPGADEAATAFPEQQPPSSEESSTEKKLEQFMDPAAAATFRERWRDVQAGFVDDPRDSVRQADDLASEVLKALSETLTERKRTLDEGWRSDEETPDTEKLRLAVRGYRDFFDRMLSI